MMPRASHYKRCRINHRKHTRTDRRTDRRTPERYACLYELSQRSKYYHYYYSLLLLRPFNGLFSGTTWVSRYQKGKTSLDLNEAFTYYQSYNIGLERWGTV